MMACGGRRCWPEVVRVTALSTAAAYSAFLGFAAMFDTMGVEQTGMNVRDILSIAENWYVSYRTRFAGRCHELLRASSATPTSDICLVPHVNLRPLSV